MQVLFCADGFALGTGDEVSYEELASVADDPQRDALIDRQIHAVDGENFSLVFGWYGGRARREPTLSEAIELVMTLVVRGARMFMSHDEMRDACAATQARVTAAPMPAVEREC